MNTQDRAVLFVTCYGHFLCHFNMLVFPALLLPLSARLQITMADTLELGFAMYLLMGVSALPWGYLADRFGPRPLLLLFYLGAGGSALATALFMDSPLILAWTLAGVGLFSGIYHPAGLGWIACCVSRTSAGMAYNGMFGNLGLASGPVLAGLLNYFWGPKTVYVVVGLLNLAGTALMGKTAHLPVRKMTQGRESTTASRSGFLILLVAMMLGGIVYRGATVTLPALFELRGAGVYQWLISHLGFSFSPNVLATVLTSGLYLIGMAGQYAGGRIGERFDLRWGYLLFHLLTVPLAMGIGILTDVPLVLMATIHSFFLLGMQPIENTLVARLTPPTMHSMAYGMKFVLTFGVGALAVQLVRWVETAWGVRMVFPALALVSGCLVSVIVLLIRKTGPLRN